MEHEAYTDELPTCPRFENIMENSRLVRGSTSIFM